MRERGAWARAGLVPAGALLGLVLVWHLVVRLLRLPTFLLPAPPDVWRVAYAFGAHWNKHFWATVRPTVLGFGVAVVCGVLLAVLITQSRILGDLTASVARAPTR